MKWSKVYSRLYQSCMFDSLICWLQVGSILFSFQQGTTRVNRSASTSKLILVAKLELHRPNSLPIKQSNHFLIYKSYHYCTGIIKVNGMALHCTKNQVCFQFYRKNSKVLRWSIAEQNTSFSSRLEYQKSHVIFPVKIALKVEHFQ